MYDHIHDSRWTVYLLLWHVILLYFLSSHWFLSFMIDFSLLKVSKLVVVINPLSHSFVFYKSFLFHEFCCLPNLVLFQRHSGNVLMICSIQWRGNFLVQLCWILFPPSTWHLTLFSDYTCISLKLSEIQFFPLYHETLTKGFLPHFSEVILEYLIC